MNKAIMFWGAWIISSAICISFSSADRQMQNPNDCTVKEVGIGKQVWMAENLNVVSFRNGDPIPEADTKEEWMNAAKNHQPAWCHFRQDYKPVGARYGKLYNWYAVNDPRGLAPQGWHIPDSAELATLTGHLGGPDSAGVKLKSREGWYDSGNGTNESGFNALPGGYRDTNGVLLEFGFSGGWWISTEYGISGARQWGMDWLSNKIYHVGENKSCGLSVRCIKD